MPPRVGLGVGFVPRGASSGLGGAVVALDFIRQIYRASKGYDAAFAFTPTALPALSISRSAPAVTYAANAAGVLLPFSANVARITDQGLLVEGSSTNLLLQSQTLGTTWTGAGSTPATVTSDFGAAPDGTTTADKVTGVGLNSDRIQQTLSVLANTTYTLSAFIKNIDAGFSKIHVAFPNSGVALQCYVSWTAGVPTISTPDCVGTAFGVETLGSGWYRMWATATSNASDAGTATVRLYPAVSSAGPVNVLYWGADLEASPYRTSYIPTTTVSVARSADAITFTGLGLVTPVTLFASVTLRSLDGRELDLISLGVDANNVINLNRAAVNKLNPYAAVGGVVQETPTSVATFTGSVALRGAISFDASGVYRSAANGVALTASASGKTAPSLTTLRLGDWIAGGIPLSGYLRAARVYPTAFSDADLQALTA